MAMSAPQPSVLHLVTIFRQITSGEIRIPAFQREFVWKEKQMVDLLESVAEGYPIGSILLWAVDKAMLKIAPSGTTSFPNVEERYPTSYILDGMQRLSTLYGVFNFGTSTEDRRFDVFYDLETEKFCHRNDIDELGTSSIPLAALFVPRRLLEHQARLSSLSNCETLIERLLQLQAAFQEYMVPVVTIRSTDVHHIVGIFERINSTGTRLDPVDFMRAITWAEDFDLNHYLDLISEDVSEIGLELNAETIIKCVGLTLGIPPTTDGLLRLRNERPHRLTAAFDNATACLRRVSAFLKDRFGILSSNLVPYEGQILLLFKTIGMQEAEPNDYDLIVRWYWATGFNESLRGKPDHYVVRAVENWRALVRGDIRGLEPRLKLTSIELFERRLISGGALSMTFAAMNAANCAHNLIDGSVIDTAIYMANSDVGSFMPVFSRPELLSAGLTHAISARMFGNVVLVDPAQQKQRGESIRTYILAAATRQDWDTLTSQFIDNDAIRNLRTGNAQEFMRSRINLMYQLAETLVHGSDRVN